VTIFMSTLKRLSILSVELTEYGKLVTIHYLLDGVEGVINGGYDYLLLARPLAEYVPGDTIEVSEREARFLYDAFPDTFKPFGIIPPVQNEEWDYLYIHPDDDDELW